MTAISKVQPRGQLTLTRAVREAAGIEPGDTVFMRATRHGTVEITALPRMTVEEMRERFRIEGPIDVVADREKWEELAAKDVFGE
jgi:bifunctional DNA-binding transcriptional regulator/antitoxin component of YhaV-PrlF toxin-antitoxin module